MTGVLFGLVALLAASAAKLEAPARGGAGAARLVLLGTGTPNSDPDRSGPALAVVAGDTPYLVDCGPGVVRRAAAAERAGVTGLAVAKLQRLFVTHLHSDHTAGLADLILTPAVLERDAPLEVYGPPGIVAMVDHVLAAYAEDMRIRFHGGEPSKPRGYVVHAHEIDAPANGAAAVVYNDSLVVVKAFEVRHGAWEHAYGFRFETRARSIVVSGDCGPSESVVQNCDGCDVLVHEVYSVAGFAGRPTEWQRYHARYHTSSHELAGLATRARPKLLVLTHLLLWGTTPEALVEEVRQAGYAGAVVCASDLDVY